MKLTALKSFTRWRAVRRPPLRYSRKRRGLRYRASARFLSLLRAGWVKETRFLRKPLSRSVLAKHQRWAREYYRWAREARAFDLM